MNAGSVPPSAGRRRFAPRIRKCAGHLPSLLSNGGRWLNPPSTWGNTIEVRFALAAEAPAVVADPTHPRSVSQHVPAITLK